MVYITWAVSLVAAFFIGMVFGAIGEQARAAEAQQLRPFTG